MSAKTVFISYRRDSTGKLFARLLAEELTRHGYDVFLDVDSLDAGKWETQILTQVPLRSHFLLLLTPGSLDRCASEDDWVRREFELAVQSGRNIVPVREESVELTTLRGTCPESVRGLFDLQIASVQHGTFKHDVEDLIARYLPPHKAPQPQTAAEHPFQAEISRIIKYAPVELIGREAETKLLNDAWAKVQNREPKRLHILTFVALGGEGKTSLVAKWAADLAHQDWPGCDAAFAWSFYHQGTDEKTADSSDLFLKEALIFFGDPVIADSAQGAYEKGRRLAQLVGERRAVLILDGVEPLQYTPTSPTSGELKDAGLAALLKGLAAINYGLCLVTTRYSIPDLKAFWQTTAPEKPLLRLSKEAGMDLLLKLGVRKESGIKAEFEKLVEDVKGHALTLNLLGTYLRDAHAGDIRKRDLVKLEEADTEEQGGHAFRVMDAYVKSFESEGKNELRALAILRLLGLFDRPATSDCFGSLLKAPRIPHLTEPLVGMTDVQRNLAVGRLENARLLTVNRDTSGILISLDAHPLLREYFATQLQIEQPGAWLAAHRRLYKHLVARTHEGDHPTLEDLQPLYQAVAHGCKAGMQREALLNVCGPRIWRHNEIYTVRKLGAFGADLGAVACFFEQPWSRVSPSLGESDQAFLLNCAGFCLSALGRLSEALEPMRVGNELYMKSKDWINAARLVHNLSDLELILGDVAGALEDAERSITYADRGGEDFMQMAVRATRANALNQSGGRAEAEAYFRKAEQLQAERQRIYPQLYSVQGFRYCNLIGTEAERAAWQAILKFCDRERDSVAAAPIGDTDPSRSLGWTPSISALKSCDTIAERARTVMAWRSPADPLLDVALDYLTAGRAALYGAILKGGVRVTLLEYDANQMEEAVAALEAAVTGLRRAGTQDYLPDGLLTRAFVRRISTVPTGSQGAQADLNEAWEIADRGPMRLYMADIHLYRARLFHDVDPYPWTSPQQDLTAARKLIEQCGYWRRKEELEDAEAAAKNW